MAATKLTMVVVIDLGNLCLTVGCVGGAMMRLQAGLAMDVGGGSC